jgi:uncharacterized protein YkvS
MTEEQMANNEEKETKSLKKAKEGDMIEVKKGNQKGKKGKVTAIRDNSVIIELGINPNTGEPIKTVVNHKNYKVTSK